MLSAVTTKHQGAGVVKRIFIGLLLISCFTTGGAQTLTYSMDNNSDSDLTIHWPLGCSPDIYKSAKHFVACAPMHKIGILSPHANVTCTIVASGIAIACLGQNPCPIQLYANDTCSSQDIATADVHFNGTFDNTKNAPGSHFNVTTNEHTVYISNAQAEDAK